MYDWPKKTTFFHVSQKPTNWTIRPIDCELANDINFAVSLTV